MKSRQEEFGAKLKRVRAFLAAQAWGGVALNTHALFAWATAGGDNHVVAGGDCGVAYLLITNGTAAVLANNIEIPRLRAEEFGGLGAQALEFWQCPWPASGGIGAEIQRRLGAQKWASDCGLDGSLPLPAEFTQLTYLLTETEIGRYRKLGQECSQAMEDALKPVTPGVTEHTVAGLISQRLRERGVQPHVVLVAADERVFKYRHPIPTAKKLKKHLMAVLCGKRHGLIISLTRLLHFGKLPAELRRKHDAVCAVDLAFNLATQPGVPVGAVFAAGLAEYARQGFGEEWKLHHQGGPTGYQGRSFFGSPEEKRAVLSSQAYAWNPSITGTKSEDTILATGSGLEFLSSPTKNWPAVTIKLAGKPYQRADIMQR